jgi:hypothetical protein
MDILKRLVEYNATGNYDNDGLTPLGRVRRGRWQLIQVVPLSVIHEHSHPHTPLTPSSLLP